jgi:plasmid maintenance system antidote protein VapI
MKSPPYIKAILDEIERMKLTQVEFASRLGISAAFLNMVIAGKRGLSLTLCTKLGQITALTEAEWREMRFKALNQSADEPVSLKVAETHEKSGLGGVSGGGGGGALLGQRAWKDEILSCDLKVSPFEVAFLEGTALLLRPGSRGVMRRSKAGGGTELVEIEIGNGLMIKPQDSLVFDTRESIELSEHLAGMIENLGEVSVEMVFVWGSAPEPGHRGPISLSLKNLGHDSYELNADVPVAKLRLMRVS